MSDILDSTEAGGKAIRGGVLRTGGYVGGILISVLSSALLFRHLHVTRMAHYTTVVSLVTLFAGVTDAGLQAIGVRELATRDAEGRRELMRSLSGLRLTLSVTGVLLAVAFAALVGYGATLVAGAVLVGIGQVLMIAQDTYAITLTAQLRLGWVGMADFVRVAVLAVVIIALILAGAGLFPFYATSIPAALVSAGLAAWLVRHDVPLMPSIRLREWRALLRDTITFSLATAVIAVYFRVAVIVVSLVCSAQESGYFNTAFRVIEVLLTVPALLVGVAFPIFARAARDDHARLSYAVGRVFDALWIAGLAVALALFVGAPFIVSVIGGPGFAPANGVLRIQGLAMMASFIGSVWSYALLSLHRHRTILFVSLGALLLTVTLSATLAAADGARGAAIGTTISEFGFVAALGVAVWRTGLRPAINLRATPRTLAAALLGAAVLLIPGLPNVAALALALSIYAIALLLSGAIPDELLEQLPWRP